MTVSEFRDRYAMNECRRTLVLALEEFVDVLQHSFSAHRILVFGSFITIKPEPGDIDLLGHAIAVPGGDYFNVPRLKLSSIAPTGIDVRGGAGSSFDEIPAPLDAIALVEQFNENEKNKGSDIVCETWIEII